MQTDVKNTITAIPLSKECSKKVIRLDAVLKGLAVQKNCDRLSWKSLTKHLIRRKEMGELPWILKAH